MASLCRDCELSTVLPSGRCARCGSDRIVTHDALDQMTIAHIDCDAFFAAIEKRDNPALQSQPVIVGGGARGVVSTCCYLARLHGVRSAMPMFKALKACPTAVVVHPRHAHYSEVSRQIRRMFDAITPLVEMNSIDEAYLDLAGTQALHGANAAALLARLAREIEADIGITISIGLADNKFLAKMASELDKPRGFAVLSRAEAPAFLAPMAIRAINGVGKQLAARLERQNLTTIADLQGCTVKDLAARFGDTGLWLHKRAYGIDNRPVEPGGARKSVSAERTFASDICDPILLQDRLWDVCEETAFRAKHHGVEGSTVTLKLKTKDFRSLTRSITLNQPTQLSQTLFRKVQPLLMRETGRGQAYRLLGVGLTHLAAARVDQGDLVDPQVDKRAKAERASDIARAKFGQSSVVTGRSVRLHQRRAAKSE